MKLLLVLAALVQFASAAARQGKPRYAPAATRQVKTEVDAYKLFYEQLCHLPHLHNYILKEKFGESQAHAKGLAYLQAIVRSGGKKPFWVDRSLKITARDPLQIWKQASAILNSFADVSFHVSVASFEGGKLANFPNHKVGLIIIPRHDDEPELQRALFSANLVTIFTSNYATDRMNKVYFTGRNGAPITDTSAPLIETETLAGFGLKSILFVVLALVAVAVCLAFWFFRGGKSDSVADELPAKTDAEAPPPTYKQ